MTTCSARTRRSPSSRTASPPCSATRRRCSPRAARWPTSSGCVSSSSPVRSSSPTPSATSSAPSSVPRRCSPASRPAPGRSERGLLDPAAPIALMTTDGGPYQVRTSAVVVENTHNFGGGTVQPLDRDGGSWPPTAADSGSGCISTGPGCGTPTSRRGCRSRHTAAAPTRSASACPRASARRWGRSSSAPRSGSSGPGCGASATAAGCDRSGSSPRPGCTPSTTTSTGSPTTTPGPGGWPRPSPRPPPASWTRRWSQTNILVLDVGAAGWSAADFVAAAAAHGVRTYAVGAGLVRLVWHLDVDDAATDAATDVLVRLLTAGPAA